jgi:hypothetical protein
MEMSAIETVLGWAEWIALMLIGVEIVIAAWKISNEHNLSEGFRKIMLATMGGVLILSLVNYFVPQVPSVIPSSVLSLPGANYLVDLAIAAFGIGAIYGGYLVAKGDLEHGFEMIGLVAVMFILMASASSLFSSPSLPTNVQLQQLTANGQSGGISLNFLADLIYFATALPNAEQISLVDQYAGAIAVIGLIMLAIWRFLFDMETELMRYLVTIVKDIVIATIIIAGTMSIWSGFAEIIDGIIATLVDAPSVQNFLNGVIAILIAWIGGALASGYFVPFVADFSAGLLEMSILAFDLALARYLIISATVALAPILAALWLWPPLRRTIDFIANFVLGMAVGGIIAAGAIYILANSGVITGLALAFAPLTMGILPWTTGIAFGGIQASGGGGIIGRGLPKASPSSSGSGGGLSTNLQNTKQQQIPQTTTLNRPTTQPVPQPSAPSNTTSQPQIGMPSGPLYQPSPIIPPSSASQSSQSPIQSLKNAIIPPTLQRVMNRQSIQTQAPIGQIKQSIPSGFKPQQIQPPKMGSLSRAHQSVVIGNTGYGLGLRLTPSKVPLGTVIRQGNLSGTQIGKATSPATANVTAQETRFHAFLDALKQNAILFARHFDMSLQRRLGISWSSVRPNFQNTALARPRPRKTGKKP